MASSFITTSAIVCSAVEAPLVMPKADKPKSFAGQAKLMVQEDVFTMFMGVHNKVDA